MTKFLNDTGLGTLISLIKGEINDKKSIYIGTSPSEDASKKDKTATVDTFPTVTENNVTKPKTGTIVGIKFLASNTYKTANNTYTLNVNSTGAYPMYYNNAELATSTSANTLVAGYKNRYCYYIFNGTQWVWLGAGYDTNSTYSAMTQAEITAGTGTTGRVLTPALLRSNFYTESEVDAMLPLVVNFTESNDVVTCDTSIADIYAAYSAGREVFGRYNAEGQLNLMLCAYGIVTFSNAFGNSIAQVMGIVENNTDTWTNNPITLQEQLTFDSTPTLGSSRPVTSEGIKVALNAKQDTLTFDSTPTANSTNPVTSSGIKTAIDSIESDVYIVTCTQTGQDTGTTTATYNDITDATSSGKVVFYGFGGNYYKLGSTSYSTFFAYSCGNNNKIVRLTHYLAAADGHSAGDVVRDSVTFQTALTFDNAPTANSSNPVKSGGIKTALDGKQATLVSGTNIKTVAGQSLLGSGNIEVNSTVVANLTVNNGRIVSDLTCAELEAAYTSGKDVKLRYDGYDYSVQSYTEEGSPIFYFTVPEGDTYSIKNIEVYEDNTIIAQEFPYQQPLVSGTNIKTVNGTSLLGSGDILLNAATIGTSPSGNYDGDPIEEVLDEKQDTLVSGTNIKTVNNNSLLGSGNVEVGDITGEELETEIEELESTLLTDALRKSEQVLLPAEKTQVLTNLGIADVAKESNLKTVNGASLVGTGNIEIVSVDAGDITVMQGTGDSQTNVMSQKAVTEKVERFVEGDDSGISTHIREILTSRGWVFGKYLNSSANLVDNSAFCVSEFIPMSMLNRKGHSITISYMYNAYGNACFYWYDESKTKITNMYYTATSNNTRTVSIDTSSSWDNAKYVRATFSLNKLRECFIKDNTTEEYIFNGSDFLDEIVEDELINYKYFKEQIVQETGTSTDKLMSQKVVSDLFAETIYNNKTPSYFCYQMALYNPNTYPTLDIRGCDGVSVLIINRYAGMSSTICSLFEVGATGHAESSSIFALARRYSYFVAGITGNYHDNVTNGGAKWAAADATHMIWTFNFKTGVVKQYNNGVLKSTNVPNEAYSYNDILSYFNAATFISLGWNYFNSGMALFGSVLTDSDVSTIFGAGAESAINVTVPDTMKAKRIAPQTYKGSNIGIYVQAAATRTNDGDMAILTRTSTSSSVTFGFNGITGVINNVIYEWDLTTEVDGWSLYHNNGKNMQYNNNHYKVVTIYDSQGNDVTASTLTAGTYHVVCKPDNVSYGGVNAVQYQLIYRFSGGAVDDVLKISNLKVQERGAALICDTNTYRGTFWDLPGGIRLPIATSYTYKNSALKVYYDTFKASAVKYNSSNPPYYTGQMAVDTTNNKVYVGYLTDSGGTWKQINNS